MNRIKLAIVRNAMAPYVHPLFEMLSHDLDLMVYYYSGESSRRKWDLWPRNYNYRYKILPGIPLKTSLGILKEIEVQNLNLSIIKELVLSKPHVLILEDYTSPTTWFALAIAKLLKIPLIYWTEGVKEPKSVLGVITRPLRILFVKKSNAVIVPGRLSKGHVISLGANAEKVFIAPNAIDNELFIKLSGKYQLRKEELKSQLELKGKFVILYVGRLAEEKGVRSLLEAYGKLKSEISGIALVIVGYGELRDALQKLCQTKKIGDVIFTGAVVDYKQVIRYYSMANVFVLPTLEDVWGFVINEAMTCGLPIISTKACQAAVEMVQPNRNGLIINPVGEELYEALRLLVSSDELWSMGQKSLEIVKTNFDPNVMKEGFINAITYALSQFL
jgi:glycosyltransferase involved in cell wall biosynthesis